MRMRMRRPSRRRTPRTLSKTQGPKKSLPELIKSAKGAKNVFTGMTRRPAPKRRKPIGTPTPRKTTQKPPETRQLADMRRMSRDIDTKMKQLSIDRGRTKGAKSTIGDRSTSADEKMAALAKERRAKRQYKSRARVASDARKLGIDARMAALAKERRTKGQYKSRARVASDARKKATPARPTATPAVAARRKRPTSRRVTGIRRAMASYLRRRRR